MKKVCCVLFVLAIILIPLITYAHSGRTDENGGHYDRSTGEYHYHHGYPAHQHPGGICPYNYKNKTSHNNSSDDDSNKNISNGVMAAIVVGPGTGYIVFCVRELIRAKGDPKKISDERWYNLRYYIIITTLISFLAGYFELIF